LLADFNGGGLHLSCWVAPKIAAEFWGLPVANILALVASGRLLSCVDGGFAFVRLPRFAVSGQCLPPQERPPTFNPVDTLNSIKTPTEEALTPEERSALIGNEDDESEMGPPPDEDPNDNRIANWREGRKRASAMRRGPNTSPHSSASQRTI
jgi:hypothetical protein